jgi:hypothetical protein
MSERVPKTAGVVKLDVESVLFTTEGRGFVKQLAEVSRIISLKNTEVEFIGEEILKTGYIADCKSVQIFKCPKGYFLFCNKAFTMNNWSAIADDLQQLQAKAYDDLMRQKIAELGETANVEEEVQ